MKPTKVNILGIEHTITYVDNPADVDIYKRQSLFGQNDLWTRTIRVYDNGRPEVDVWQTIIHEILHSIAIDLHLKAFGEDSMSNHDELDLIALALTDVLFRNGWMLR
jgi:hypothetical protein